MSEGFDQREYDAFLRKHKKEMVAVEEEALKADVDRAQEEADRRKLGSGAVVDFGVYKSGIKGLAAAEAAEGKRPLAVEQISEIGEQERIAKENNSWLVAAINRTSTMIGVVESLLDRADEIKISLDWLKKGNLKRQLFDLRKKMEEEQRWLRTKMEPSSPGLDEREKSESEERIADINAEICGLESHFSKLGI